MKTLGIFTVLFFITAFTANKIEAQRVTKLEVDFDVSGQAIPCTGDIIVGIVPVEIFIMSNNMVVKIHKAKVTGIPSGNDYEVSEVLSDSGSWTQHLAYRCNGKLVAEGEWIYHITENANGEVTVEFFKGEIHCK
jgi:hypothetical protein